MKNVTVVLGIFVILMMAALLPPIEAMAEELPWGQGVFLHPAQSYVEVSIPYFDGTPSQAPPLDEWVESNIYIAPGGAHPVATVIGMVEQANATHYFEVNVIDEHVINTVAETNCQRGWFSLEWDGTPVDVADARHDVSIWER